MRLFIFIFSLLFVINTNMYSRRKAGYRYQIISHTYIEAGVGGGLVYDLATMGAPSVGLATDFRLRLDLPKRTFSVSAIYEINKTNTLLRSTNIPYKPSINKIMLEFEGRFIKPQTTKKGQKTLWLGGIVRGGTSTNNIDLIRRETIGTNSQTGAKIDTVGTYNILTGSNWVIGGGVVLRYKHMFFVEVSYNFDSFLSLNKYNQTEIENMNNLLPGVPYDIRGKLPKKINFSHTNFIVGASLPIGLRYK